MTEQSTIAGGSKEEQPSQDRAIDTSRGTNFSSMSPQLDGGGHEEEDLDLWQVLRLLRAEAQDLRIVLDGIRRGEATLKQHAGYIRTTCGQVDELISAIDERDDYVRHICNAWEQVRGCKLLDKPAAEIEAEEQIRLLNLTDAQCRRIVYWTGYKTIPKRLKKWLGKTKPGYAVPFHAAFEDEMPDAEDREKLLQYLAWSPEISDEGVVEPETGLVYKYEKQPSEWLKSFWWAALTLVVATSLALLANPLLRVVDSSTGYPTVAQLELGWAAILVGTLVHLGVGTAKQRRARSANPTVLPVKKLSILLNAKLGLVFLKVFMALVGFFVLVFATYTLKGTEEIGKEIGKEIGTFLFNAFLVGYSLDSVVELFGAGMDQRAAAQQENLKKQLGTR